jgi:dihydrofolate reductase
VSVSLIWAQAANAVIGHDGALPWRLPEDMAQFRALTMGATVLMGRATWDSLPVKAKPLVGRRNVVMTRQWGWTAPGVIAVASLEQGLDAADGDVWVIGGAQVYAAAMPFAHRLVITELEAAYDGDTLAPTLDASWRVVGREPATGWSESTTGLRYRVTTHERELV